MYTHVRVVCTVVYLILIQKEVNESRNQSISSILIVPHSQHSKHNSKHLQQGDASTVCTTFSYPRDLRLFWFANFTISNSHQP